MLVVALAGVIVGVYAVVRQFDNCLLEPKPPQFTGVIAERLSMSNTAAAAEQPLGYYASELRRLGFEQAIIKLPRDGINTNNYTGKRLRRAFGATPELQVDDPVPNEGSGAAMMGVARVLPRCCWATAGSGPRCVGLHEKKDELRNVGLGPDHDSVQPQHERVAVHGEIC